MTFFPRRAPRRAIAAAILLMTLAAAACQTVEPPQTASFGDGPGKSFRERRGWTVDFVAAADGAPAHCRGRRAAAGNGLEVVFIGAETESGFRIVGLPADRPPPERDEIVAAFDSGDRHSFNARRDGAALLIGVPTAHYEEAMHPFARARSVSLRGRNGGALGELALSGSSWAINATDECRRMHVPSRSR